MTFRALGFVGEEVVHLLDGAVEGHDGEAVVVHVQNQILAHDGQTDECDVSFRFHIGPQSCLPKKPVPRVVFGTERFSPPQESGWKTGICF